MSPASLDPTLQPDMTLISSEGVRADCHAAVLAVSSPLLANILGELAEGEGR